MQRCADGTDASDATRQCGGLAGRTDQPYLLNDPLPRDYSHGCACTYNTQAFWL